MNATLEPGRKAAAPKKPAGKHRVHLEYTDANARSVCVAGSFNDWHPEVAEMLCTAPGRWQKVLTLPPGEHEYRLVVDGVWLTDPACAKHVANPFGGKNSVLCVAP